MKRLKRMLSIHRILQPAKIEMIPDARARKRIKLFHIFILQGLIKKDVSNGFIKFSRKEIKNLILMKLLDQDVTPGMKTNFNLTAVV